MTGLIEPVQNQSPTGLADRCYLAILARLRAEAEAHPGGLLGWTRDDIARRDSAEPLDDRNMVP